MGYNLKYSEFAINNNIESILPKKIPNDNFFGEEVSKKIIKAKCSNENFEFLSNYFNTKPEKDYLNLNLNNKKIRFIKPNKRIHNRNSLGKELSDACELATIKSLITDIQIPSDTGQELFNDLDAFYDWLPTFKYTKKVINTLISDLSDYEIIHYNTDNSELKTIIKKYCKLKKINKDSWNPADIFIIHKNYKDLIYYSLNKLLYNGKEDEFNAKILKFYEDGLFYPIALKQITNDYASYSIKNNRNFKQEYYDIEIDNFNIDISENKNEIGILSFKNKTSNKIIKMQIKGFPHKYSISQTEIISDGTNTGGRLGKVPVKVLDNVFEEYNFKRFKSIKELDIKNIDIDEIYSWFEDIKDHEKVSIKNHVSKVEFEKLIENSASDFELAKKMCHKIQGLKIAHFYIKNEHTLSKIMNKILNGAKKVSSDNGVFIAIY